MVKALAALPLLACAPVHVCDGTETLCLDNVPVFFDGLAPVYTDDPSIPGRVAAQVQASLDRWYVPASHLDGWRIVLGSYPVDCDGVQAYGCWDRSERTVYAIVMGDASGCVEFSALPHELGHFSGVEHSDPRWCEGLDEMWAQLVAQPSCQQYVDATGYASPRRLWTVEACQ